MYKYLFGPVPSRRLGMSLGVDLDPKKVCSLDCVYCEAGKTTNLTMERKEYISYEKITKELEHYFNNNPKPDYVTFSGSGEPTLNSRMGDVIKFIRKKVPNIPIAVITNGNLLYNKDVREELKEINILLPSIDAATVEVFKKINRPAENLNLNKYIKGLIEFRKIFKGEIWLEVFILPGYNDSDNEIIKLKEAIEKIKPDIIQLNTLDRPGTVAGLKPATNEKLNYIIDMWGFDNVKIIAASAKNNNTQSYRGDTENAIIGTISRRPCTAEDLAKILGIQINEINKHLKVLEIDKKIESIKQERGIFYKKTSEH